MHVSERLSVSTEAEVEALNLPHSSPECERTFPTTCELAVHRARWCCPGQRPACRRGQLADKAVKLAKRKASAALLPPVVMEGEPLETNAKSTGNAQRIQLAATTPHHREVISRGGHPAFIRPPDGCAKAEAPVAAPHPADACRTPSAPCCAGAGPTSWAALPTWQPTDGHAPPHE